MARADDDYRLVEKSKAGDRDALGQLLKKYTKRVFSICYRMTRSIQDAEDRAQDTFISVIEKIDQFRGDSAFGTWLYSIAVNTVLLHFRQNRTNSIFINIDDEKSALDPQEYKDARRLLRGPQINLLSKTPPGEYEDGKFQRKLLKLQQGLKKFQQGLNHKDRQIFSLGFFGECPPREIAPVVNKNSKYVSNKLGRLEKRAIVFCKKYGYFVEEVGENRGLMNGFQSSENTEDCQHV